MTIRYVLRGQVVEFESASDALSLGIARSRVTAGERLFVERWTAAEQISRLISEHRDHPFLHRDDDPRERIIGLTCSCEQPAFSIRMSLALVVMATQEVRDLIQRLGPVPVSRYVKTKKQRQLESRAAKRAQMLLHQMLTREQRWSLRADGSFKVVAQDGKTYLVRKGQTVQLLEGDRPVTAYCIHPREPIPAMDVMLAQKLLLETDIEHFLTNANATRCGSFEERLTDALDVMRVGP